MPMTDGDIGIYYPCRTWGVGVVYNDLKAAVVVGCVVVSAIAEEACWSVVLSNPVRHTGKYPVLVALYPVNPPVKFIVISCAPALLVEVVYQPRLIGHRI